MPDSNEVKFKCTVKRIFKNCPKPDGWYGMFVHIRGEYDDTKLSGVTDIIIQNGMQLDVTAIPDPRDSSSYIWKSISVITTTTRSITAYLSSFPCISRITADRIVATYGNRAIDMITNDPLAVKTKCQLSDKQINSLIANVSKNDARNTLQKEFPELSPKQIEYCINNLFAMTKKSPIDAIKSNPYILENIKSVTFSQIDAIVLRMGIDPLAPYRVNHGLIYLLKRNDAGHLYINLSNANEACALCGQLENLLKIRMTDMYEFRDRLYALSAIDNSPIKIENYNGEIHLYLSSIYKAMTESIDILKMPREANKTANEINPYIAYYEQSRGISLTAEQKTAVKTALTNPVSIITGGPGRGKTMIIDCIANAIRNTNDPNAPKVILLAPTGKAANKLNEATNRVFDKFAMTIDKLITNTSEHTFSVKTATNKKRTIGLRRRDLVIVDESSMIDMIKAYRLLDTCDICNFCFVGDPDQLPPIDAGNFFKDIIDSGVIPTAKLTVPMRNGGAILDNANLINNNDTNLIYNFTDFPFYPFEEENQNMLDAIIDEYTEALQNTPDITQIALLCPTRKGMVGTTKLNITLQNINCPENEAPAPTLDSRRNRNNFLNKGHPIKSRMYGNSSDYTYYRVGDIVMNIENNHQIQTFRYTNDDYINGSPVESTMGIFNGEQGRIIAYIPPDLSLSDDDPASHEYIVVKFFDGRIAEIDCSAGEFETFQLGYAITVHKAQGCEYETVIYVSPKNMVNLTHIGFANKNIVYTAITRAKNKVTIIGSKNGLNACITHNVPPRNSKFAEKLR